MKDIFITGTFRNEWNKNFNLQLASTLESKGFKVFLPQRDSEQTGNRKRTFLQDVEGIDKCKMIVAVGSRTQTANRGFEIGYAFKSNKSVVIITDVDHPVELMPEGASTKIIIAENLDDIPAYIEDLLIFVKQSLKS